MGGLLKNLRIIGAALFRRPSSMWYQVTVPAGWRTVPAAGSRHYDEYRSPDDRASVRVFAFEASATTLEDMISDDLEGIHGHEGAVIDTQSVSTLRNGAPAYRIGYAIKAGAESRYGVDVMAVVDEGGVLMTLVSEEPVTPTLLGAFDEMIDSLRTQEGAQLLATPTPALTPGLPEDASVSELAVIAIDRVPIGSCFDEHPDPTTGRLGALVVSCDGPHQLEMIGIEVLPDGPEALYPGARAIGEQAYSICRPLFESYVGFDYDRWEFVFWSYTPDRMDWPDGRRLVDCTVGNADRSMQPPGSVKNARR
jgi:putative regulator of septum formation